MGLTGPWGPGFSDLQGSDTAYLLLYVDDIVLHLHPSTALLGHHASLHAEFSMTTWALTYFQGVTLSELVLLTCNPCRTPVDTDSKLAATGDLVSDPTLYRRLAGALQYLTFTRPDISYAVQQMRIGLDVPLHGALLLAIVCFLATIFYLGLPKTVYSFSHLVRVEEYRGVANAVGETCWLRIFTCSFG
ncbi:ribonuclease H-like domain-containing protein [Tanacetum coccineum]